MRAYALIHSGTANSTKTVRLEGFERIADAQKSVVSKLGKHVTKDENGLFVSASLPADFTKSLQPVEAARILSFLNSVPMTAKAFRAKGKGPAVLGFPRPKKVNQTGLRVTGGNSIMSPDTTGSSASQTAAKLGNDARQFCATVLSKAQADLQTIQQDLTAAQAAMANGDGFLTKEAADFNAGNFMQAVSDGNQALFYFHLADYYNGLVNAAYADLATQNDLANEGAFGIPCGNQTTTNSLYTQANGLVVDGEPWTGDSEQNASSLIGSAMAGLLQQAQQLNQLTSQVSQCVRIQVDWWGQMDVIFNEACTRLLEQALSLANNNLVHVGQALVGAGLVAAGAPSWAVSGAIAIFDLEAALMEQDVWLADRPNHNGVTIHFSFAPIWIPFWITLDPSTVAIAAVPTLLAELISPGFGNFLTSIMWITGN